MRSDTTLVEYNSRCSERTTCHGLHLEVASGIFWNGVLECHLSCFWCTDILCPLQSTIFFISRMLGDEERQREEYTYICAYFLPIATRSRGAADKTLGGKQTER